jgi:hypothetical protein
VGTGLGCLLTVAVLALAGPAAADDARAETEAAPPPVGEVAPPPAVVAPSPTVEAETPPGREAPVGAPNGTPVGVVHAERDPTTAVWWTSLGVIYGTALLLPLGVLPGLALVALGGTIANLAGDHVSGRHGTWVTSVAMVGGALGGVVVGGAVAAFGLGMAIAGSGGIPAFAPTDRNPVVEIAGFGVIIIGAVGGPALGALLPTWAYAATAEPTTE